MKPNPTEVRLSEELIAIGRVPGRECGECSLCCKVLNIDRPELTKPAGQWCPHCKPGRGGCSIYTDRPPVCRAFACQWLIDPQMGDEWRPTRSKMVIDFDAPEHGFFDSNFPERWRSAPYYEQIKSIALGGLQSGRYTTRVHVGNRHYTILPNKDVETTEYAAYVVLRTGEDSWEVLRFDTEEKGKRFQSRAEKWLKYIGRLTPEQRAQMALEFELARKAGTL